MHLPTEIDRRGIFQHGLVTLRQLSDAGVSEQQRRSLHLRGILHPVDQGVLRTCGAPPGWERDLHAACLPAGPDEVASHRAAALLWGLIDPPAPVEITVPYASRASPVRGVRHRSQATRPVDRAVRRGIPVTTPARTLLDLGAVAPQLVAAAIEVALYNRLATTAGLWRLLSELAGPGRRGVRPLRQALDERALGDRRPESLLEPAFAALAVSIGLEFEYQHPVVVEGRRHVLDFALPSLMFAVEVDGLEVHGSRGALDHDLERQNRLIRDGWMIQRYTATHLRRRRRALGAELTKLVRERQAAFNDPGGG